MKKSSKNQKIREGDVKKLNKKQEFKKQNSNNKLLGMIIVLIGFAIASYYIISSTNLNIQDTNPASYVIVVMLMIFLFLIFLLKEDLKFEFKLKNIIAGSLLFLAYILVVSYLKVISSFKFYIYGLNALLLSLFLASLIIIIFGFDGLKKLKYAVIYILFASPLILMPLISLNSLFTSANAHLIYYALKLMNIPVLNNGLIIYSLYNKAAEIIIGTTCTNIGAFLALVMFLIPIAYLFNGKLKNRFAWLGTSIILLLILNLIRMLAIAITWFYYGATKGLILFHLSAGPILFYIIIIAMILFSYKFNLIIPKINLKYISINYNNYLLIPIIFVLGFSFFNLVALSNSINNSISPTQFINSNSILLNRSLNINTSLDLQLINTLKQTNMTVTSLGSVELENITGLSFKLNNKTGNIFIFASLANSKEYVFNKSINNFVYILKNGVSVSSHNLISNNYSIILNQFIKPYKINNSTYTFVNFLVFANYSDVKKCIFNYNNKNIGFSNYFEAEVFNLIAYHKINEEETICAGYKIANYS